MFPKKGNVFPSRTSRSKSPVRYCALVAAALRAELGETHRAIKTVARWSGASERTVKNWMSGDNGPNGQYLIKIMRESDGVLRALLHAAGRDDVVVAMTPRNSGAARSSESEQIPIALDPRWDGGSKAVAATAQPASRSDDPINAPLDDPVIDPVDVSCPPPHAVRPTVLNERQQWFMAELAQGREARTMTIVRHWGIAEKTAKRDIAALRALGLVRFLGSPRSGSYRLSESSLTSSRSE